MGAPAARWGLILSLSLATVATAQDAHYWTRQFGNRAWLLGGSLVGNPGDISSVYYNPGALALLASASFEITGNVYELTRLKVENGLGAERDTVLTRLDTLPSLIAGSARFPFLGKSKLAYSIITRQGFSFGLESRDMASGTDVAGISGLEQLAAEAKLDEDVGEYWGGITWAYPLGEHVGVGITGFGAVRDQDTRFQALLLGQSSDGRTLLGTLSRDFHLFHVRVLAKLGVSYQNGPWAVGMSLTTPSLALWGDGRNGYERALVDQGFGLTDLRAPVFNFQDSLSARFKSSWSLAVGGSRNFGRTTLYVTAEAFARQSAFKMIDAESFSPLGSTEVIDPDVFVALAPVVNVGVGVEYQLGESARGYVSAHTDFSALEEAPNRSALMAGWDIYHFTWGVDFKLGGSRIMLGNNLAWGGERTSTVDEVIAETGLPLPAANRQVRFFQATLIVGASFELVE